MKPPFPGMDPYLEHPALWPDVHNGLIAALRDRLGPGLRPRYFVVIEERIYAADGPALGFVGRADVAVAGRERPDAEPGAAARLAGGGVLTVEVPIPDRMRETYLEVRETRVGELVTVLEVLSPTNKRPGEGRRLYEEKRSRVLGSATNLVEIDLLRHGERMTVYGANTPYDYSLLVSRGDRRPTAELYPFRVRDAIPSFRLPLGPGDDGPQIDLGPVLQVLYDHASYDLRIDYGGEPQPVFAEDDRAWAAERLRAVGLRT